MNPSLQVRIALVAACIGIVGPSPVTAESPGGFNLLGTACLAAPEQRHTAFTEQQLQALLEIEDRAPTLDEKLAVKASGLSRVRDLQEFEVLTRWMSAEPEYAARVSKFIVSHVADYVKGPADLDTLLALEQRATSFEETMAIKRAGLKAVCSPADLSKLTRPTLGYPSEADRIALGNFAAEAAVELGKKAVR